MDDNSLFEEIPTKNAPESNKPKSTVSNGTITIHLPDSTQKQKPDTEEKAKKLVNMTAEKLEYVGGGSVSFGNGDTTYKTRFITSYNTNETIIDGKKSLVLKITIEDSKTIYTVTFVSCKKLFGFDKNKKAIDEFLNNIEDWKKESKRVKMIEVMRRNFQNDIFPPTAPPDGVILGKNEYAVLYDSTATFSQERTKTTAVAAGTSIRVAKGVSFRVGGASPIKEEYIARLDSGSLVLTNKKLTFTGSRKTANIPIGKIINVERYSDAIAVSKDGNMKKFFFNDIDGELWADAIEAVVRRNNS